MGHVRTIGRAVCAAALLAAAVWTPAANAAPGPVAPATGGSVHPGVMTRTDGAQCTANFVFTRGGDTLLGQAAHCAGTGGQTDTDGCTSESLPLGTDVEIEGASKPGRLVYSSWLTMQSVEEKDPDACAYNDIAFVKVDPADVAEVSASVPFFGGPAGVDRDGTKAGDRVYSYGNSELRGGVPVLSPKTGVSVGDEGNGWSHTVTTLTPGIPGDSGSAFLSADGTALGVLSTLNIAPQVGTNGVSDLAKMLAYAQSHGMGGVALSDGGPFRPLPL